MTLNQAHTFLKSLVVTDIAYDEGQTRVSIIQRGAPHNSDLPISQNYTAWLNKPLRWYISTLNSNQKTHAHQIHNTVETLAVPQYTVMCMLRDWPHPWTCPHLVQRAVSVSREASFTVFKSPSVMSMMCVFQCFEVTDVINQVTGLVSLSRSPPDTNCCWLERTRPSFPVSLVVLWLPLAFNWTHVEVIKLQLRLVVMGQNGLSPDISFVMMSFLGFNVWCHLVYNHHWFGTLHIRQIGDVIIVHAALAVPVCYNHWNPHVWDYQGLTVLFCCSFLIHFPGLARDKVQ